MQSLCHCVSGFDDRNTRRCTQANRHVHRTNGSNNNGATVQQQQEQRRRRTTTTTATTNNNQRQQQQQHFIRTQRGDDPVGGETLTSLSEWQQQQQ